MSQHKKDQNLDQQVIDSFGHEWSAFDYAEGETDDATKGVGDIFGRQHAQGFAIELLPLFGGGPESLRLQTFGELTKL